MGDIRTTTLIIFYGNRVADIRIQGDVINTLQARMGTGGNNMPILAYVFQLNGDRDNPGVSVNEDQAFTIPANPMSDRGQSVAYSIREDAKANNFSATEIEQARALQSLQPSVQSHHAQTFIAETVSPTLTAYNMDSRSPQSEEQQRIINSVFSNTMRVRRLTPTECERLQGFPDGWTDEQSDTQRYKQMGNAVTVNVIEWIGSRL